ncbi:MAG TPA: hypothetical protein VK071_00975 [Tissierellales bacterium]|nr:hypothetical protein [Tissierellales bacterium]
MKFVNEGLTKGYVLHELSTGECYVCRILNSYDNDEEATKGLTSLLCKNTTEKDMLEEYTEKKRKEFPGI